MFCLLYQEEELNETIAEECEGYTPCAWAQLKGVADVG